MAPHTSKTAWLFIRESEGIAEYLFPNGLRVLLFPDSSQATVTVNVTYLVGSRHEGRGEAGMAHLLEHMLFKGTPKNPDAKGTLQDKGAIFNASTWYDRTNYYETLPASSENMEFALQFEADRMINSWIRQEDLDAEMTVVRNEFEMGENEPSGVLLDQIMSAAYRWHNYGKSTIGNRSDIERVPATSLKLFYQQFYQPDNAVLIVAGRFVQEEALKLIDEHFGAISKPERILLDTYTEEPEQDGPREVVLKRSGEVAITAAAYHICAASHADFPVLQVITELLAHEPSGVLYKALVKSGLATEVDSYAFALNEPGMIITFARCKKNDQVHELKEKLLFHIEDFHELNFSDDQVTQAKASILKSIKLLMADATKFSLRLSEAIAAGDYRLFFLQRDLIRTVSCDDIKRVAHKYFKESNRSSGIFIPTKNPERSMIPPRPNIEEIFAHYQGSEGMSAGEHFDATPENIDACTTIKTMLPQIKLALLPKNTRGDSVQVQLYFNYASAENLVGKTHELSLLPSLMMRGSVHRDHAQLESSLDKLEANMQLHAGAGKLFANISADKKHLPDVLALLAEIVREPKLDDAEFELIKAKEISHLQEGLSDPHHVGFQELGRLLSPWPKSSIHYRPSTEEQIAIIQNASSDRLRTLYHELIGASDLHASFVGSFDSEALAEQIKQLFGDWHSPTIYNRISNPFLPISAVTKNIKIAEKQMAIVAIGNTFVLQDDNPDFPGFRLAHYIFGESMKSRIMRRLREKEGISYGAGSQLSTDSFEAHACMTMYAMAPSSSAHEAAKILKEEYTRWIENGVTEQEVQEAKASYVAYIMNLLSNDRTVASILLANLSLNRNFGHYSKLFSQVEKLQTEQINKIVHKYLDNVPLAEVIAGDI